MEYPIETIKIKRNAWQQWLSSRGQKVSEALRELKANEVTFTINQVSKERFRIKENGDGEIFISFPEGVEASMLVSSDDWEPSSK